MWTQFAVSQNEEETINNVFCTNGLFKILGEDVKSYPNVQSILQNKKMLVAVDKSLFLLENENIAECSFLSFSSNIDSISISESGNILVFGLSDGNIHGIFIKGFPMFNLCIEEKDVGKEGRTFAEIKQIENIFYITCTNGNVYRLHNLDEENFLKSYEDRSLREDETCCFDETIMKHVIMENITQIKCSEEITSFAILDRDTQFNNSSMNNFAAIFGSKNYINFKYKDENIRVRIPEKYKGLKMTYNLDNFVLGLSNSGHLFEICPLTHIIFQPFGLNDYLIDDVVIMENNENDIELLILTKLDSSGVRYMKIVEFPTMNSTYDMEMSEHTWLIKQPKTSVNIYYLLGENIGKNGFPQEVEVRIICETQPEQRLKKLIQRGHLEEAEEFAKQFELDLQPIYEAKSRKLLVDISNLNDANETVLTDKFNQLLNVLQSIGNKNFLLAIRSFEIPSRKILTSFLQFLLNNIGNEHYDDIIEVKEQMLRLESLNIIDPYECDLDWQKFVYHPNIIKVCVGYFKRDILTACLIWKRHIACITPLLDEKNIEKLLNAIPSSIEPFNIIQWLKHFVPSVLQTHPAVMSYLVDWSIQKTESLQYVKHWPEIGLEFSTNLLMIFKDVKFLYSDVRRHYQSNIAKLNSIVHVLQDLSVLKKSYNLVLTMDNYIKELPENSAFHVLQRVQLGNLTKLVNDFLYPIFLEKGRSPVEAIKKYINFLVTNRRTISNWLERAIASVDFLYNEEEKLQSALLILKSTPVPWPEIVMPLVKLSDSTHPLAIEISTEYELQIIKIIKKKYGWPVDSTDSNMKLICRIIKMALPDMIKDINDLVKASPEISSRANFYCCSELARNGQIEKAISFLDSLKEEQRIDCCEKIINIFGHILEDTKSTEIYFENMIEFLKLVSARSNVMNQEVLCNIQNKETLEQQFDLNVNFKNLKFPEKEILLNQGIEVIIKKLYNRKTNLIYFVWRSINQLTSSLSLDKYKGILKIVEKMNNVCISSGIAYIVLQSIRINRKNCEFFVKMALLLITQQMEQDNGHIDVDPLTYPLSYLLLTKTLQCDNIIELEVLELIMWVRIGNNVYDLTEVEVSNYYSNYLDVETNVLKSMKPINEVINLEETNQMEDYGSMSLFDFVDHVPEENKLKRNAQPILHCISLCFKIVFNLISPPIHKQSIFNCFVEPDKQFGNELKTKFCKTLETLLKLRHYSSWIAIMQIIIKYQKESGKVIIDSNYIAVNQRKIFKHSLSQDEPDFIDLFVMLLSNPNPADYLNYLSAEIKSGLAKVNYFTLTEMYYNHIQDKTNLAKGKDNRLKFFYYTELCKHDSTLKGKSNTEFLTVKELVKELRSRVLPVTLLNKISCDFDLNFQHILTSQIIAILQQQEPVIEVKINELGKEEIFVKTTVERILEICEPYVKEVTDTSYLASKLLQFIGEINFYFYELYLAVIEILICITQSPDQMEIWKNILLFLKHKMTLKRRNKPGQVETDWWLKSQLDVGVLPKIAKYRLPFRPIIEEPLNNILDSEVCVDNCVSWFPLIELHKTLQGVTAPSEIMESQEYFCMSSVKNSIPEYKQQGEDSDEDIWHLKPVNNAFLQSVLRLVSHMHDPSKILFILYFVTNHAPEGADQVEAAYECYKFAIENESHLISQKTQDIIVKIKRKYPIYRTQHLLYMYNLAEDRLLQLVENPKEIINALYHHEIILSDEKPNINLIAKEIAKLHSLDFHVIQLTLLQKWLGLATHSDSITMEDTFIEGLNTTVNATDDATDEFVIRAHYIFTSWDTERAIEFLISHIFPVDGIVDTTKQMLLFECCIRILDDSNSSYMEIINQKQYVVLKCVNYLKQLGYNIRIEKFNEYDKLNILKKIWQNHANNTHALEAMSYVCLGFGIEISQIWNGILKQMVKLNMIDELNALVDLLSCKIKLLHSHGLQLAWQYVLTVPFKNASRVRTDDQEALLLKNLFRIQACPLVTYLNLSEIAGMCISIERPHMAAVLISLANKEQKEKIKLMVLKHKTVGLKKDILDLEEAGILPVIINNVLQELDF